MWNLYLKIVTIQKGLKQKTSPPITNVFKLLFLSKETLPLAYLYSGCRIRDSTWAYVSYKTSFPKIHKRKIVLQVVSYKIQENIKIFSASGTAPLSPLGLLRYSAAIDSPLRSNISAEKTMKLGKLANINYKLHKKKSRFFLLSKLLLFSIRWLIAWLFL